MNPDVSFGGLLAVAAIALVVPLALALTPLRRLPASVLLVVAGIVLGPSGAGVVRLDLPVRIMALLGLALLLFLAGTEIEAHELRGARLRLALRSFAVSLALALAAAAALAAVGIVSAPLLVAVIVVGTSLGIVIPLLGDAGEAASDFGQLVLACASVADVGAIILLSVLFTRDGSGPGPAALLVALLLGLGAAVGWAALRAERSARLETALARLEDTSAQIRVRAAFALLILLAALAEALGLEVILGAFLAGAILRVVDAGGAMQHPQFRAKLEGIGYGVFVPAFLVATGLRFDLAALAASPAALVQVPLFVLVLLAVRGLPALLLRRHADASRVAAAGLLQATLLPIAPVQIGLELGLLSPATGAALVAAGLVSVLAFPAIALALLGRREAAIPAIVPASMERSA
jgi:Kef-type K+ transport system membrane component KefB